MSQPQNSEAFSHDSLREEAEKQLEKKMKESGISIAALKKEKLAHELLICQMELELQGRALKEALEAGKIRAAESYEHEPMGCAEISRDFTILSLNRSAAGMLGAAAGDEITRFINEENIPVFLDFIATVFIAGGKAACEISVDNGEKHILITGIAGREKLTCHVNLMDITGAKRADAVRIESLENSNQALKAYAQAVARGLKEPLKAARKSIMSIKRGEAAMENAGHAEKAMARVLNITDELLACAENPAGGFAAREKVDLNTLVDEIFFRYSLNDVGSRQAELTRDELPKLGVVESHMYLLFQNLIHNAMKFVTPDLKPRIHVGFEEKPDRYLFSVSDNGIGIKKRDIARIFSMPAGIRQGSDQSWGKNGLSVCRGIGELYKGKMWIESAAGKGTTFFFTLPKENSGISVN